MVAGECLVAGRGNGPIRVVSQLEWFYADHGVDPHLLLMKNGVLVMSFGRPNVDLLFSIGGAGPAVLLRTGDSGINDPDPLRFEPHSVQNA